MPVGNYAVIVVNPDDAVATLPNAFQVFPADITTPPSSGSSGGGCAGGGAAGPLALALALMFAAVAWRRRKVPPSPK
jgi:MYXO-CTERM domain-containing protein